LAKVLLAWELGDGFYHMKRLLAIKEALAERGDQCIFVVADLARAREVISDHVVDIIQAPIFPARAKRYFRESQEIECISDIMLAAGYGDAAAFSACVKAWQALLRELSIDLVISDYSPCANLATANHTPTISIGDGFTMPAIDNGCISDFSGRFTRFSRGSSQALVKQLKGVSPKGIDEHDLLARMIYADQSFCVTFAAFDHGNYASGRSCIGPLTLKQADYSTAKNKSYDYFAYLSLEYEGSLPMIQGLSEMGAHGCAYLRDCPQEIREKLKRKNLEIFDEPQDIAEMLSRCKVLIHHGGLGMAEQGLVGGIPQLLVPRHKEQILNTKALLELGGSVTMQPNGKFKPHHASAALESLLNKTAFLTNARQAATEIPENKSLNIIVNTCDSILQA
jgi:hypothetical protein